MGFNSNIANALLTTPFDSRATVNGKVAELLTIEEFFNKCYVHPISEQTFENISVGGHIELGDSPVNINEIKDLIKHINNDQKKFDNWLSNPKNYKVYTISGNAGTGKTTYVNYRKYVDEKQHIKWIILDVDMASVEVHWFNDIKTVIPNYSSAEGKVYSTILKEISLRFFGEYEFDKCDVDKILRNYTHIINNFKKVMKNYYIPGVDLFEKLALINKTFKSKITVINNIASILKEYFIVNTNEVENEVIWSKALNVLQILLRCEDVAISKFIIVFDNLERFISNDEIYNEELYYLRRTLSSRVRDMHNKYISHYGKFKFIMSMRSSSTRMTIMEQHTADELPSDLNINDWFIVDDIIAKKIDWYKNAGIEIEHILELEDITGDLRKCTNHLTGLKLQLEAMFNSNKRLIIDFISTMLERSENEHYIDQYKCFWGLDTPINRFAARSIIKGMMLKELDSVDNLFAQLRLYSEDDDGNKTKGLGYSRKILTVLYNNMNSYIPLTKVLSELYANIDVKSRWENSNPEFKACVSKILFFMNSYNRRTNDWIQFVDMQIKNSDCSIKIHDEIELQDAIENNMANIELKITDAGKAYMEYIVASFEYFSFRYSKKSEYKPLFSTVPTREEIKKAMAENLLKELPCCRIIENVKDHAIECILEIKDNRPVILKIGNKSKKHHIRIIEQHQGYIDHFIYYLKENIGEACCEDLIKIFIEYKKAYDFYK